MTKSYGAGARRVDALRGIDLDVARGEFISIMGPSGSGKSTLLNLISALDTPTSGEIRIDGQDISNLGDDELTMFRRRKIGLVFQFFNLLPTLDALDNTLLPMMLEGRISESDRERGRRVLREVGLEHRIQHRLSELSGGEMQRVALARALILEPKLLLADEPTGNLDSTTGAMILTLLRETCARHETTVVMVTHDVQAARTGDRIVTLKDGLLVGDERTEAAR
ncbi:MAG TPA: ABC transporter ATP-binding protein [Polyangiales bacterium]|nr:ABC transporter ATP-binding protein [Polyangiales bacterium]